MPSSETTTARFREALQLFVDKVQQDDQVIAVVLLGSLSYDQVWEKSDIDLKLIVHEQKLKKGYMCFVEKDVPINASIQTRNEFKRWLERAVQSSIEQSMLVRSTLLFTKDPSIEEYFAQIRYVGERDRQLHLMRLGCHILSMLAKAEKWLYVKGDPTYSAFWMIRMADLLAQIEVVLHGDVPMRESLQQAMKLNPDFFQDVYTNMVCGAVDESRVRDVLKRIQQYLTEKTEAMFQPILTFLKDEADVRTVTDLVERLGSVIHLDTGSMTSACDWLADQGLLAKLEAETKATPKSRVQLLEPAYLYDQMGDDGDWEMGDR
jgi:predicted nucleotidyltransferase